jgi:hypothetical protein
MGQSHEMRILLADNQAGTTNAISFAGKSCDLLGDQEFGRDDGKRGTRQRYACGDRVLREVVAGGFEFNPTAAELDWVLKRCMGDNIAGFPGSAAVPGETLPQFYAFVDKGPENFRYDICVFGRVTLSVREGDYLTIRCDLVGSRENQGVTWPVGAPAIACAPEFVCADVAFNLDAVAYPFKSMDLTLDNVIAPNQHENALYRTIFDSEDFIVSLQGTFGYRADTKALYRRAVAGDAGSLVLANGTNTYTFTFPNLKIPGRGPTVPNQGEITMVPAMEARRTALANCISVAKA